MAQASDYGPSPRTPSFENFCEDMLVHGAALSVARTHYAVNHPTEYRYLQALRYVHGHTDPAVVETPA